MTSVHAYPPLSYPGARIKRVTGILESIDAVVAMGAMGAMVVMVAVVSMGARWPTANFRLFRKSRLSAVDVRCVSWV